MKHFAQLLFAMTAMAVADVAIAQAAAGVSSAAPAAPAREFPWLYILAAVVVIGAGVLVYRMARHKDTPANPPSPRAAESAPRNARAKPAAAPAPAAAPPAHPHFDASDFLRQAKASFVRMQAAWDKADKDDLAKFTTPQVFGELAAQMGPPVPPPHATEVVTIQAEVVGVEPTGDDYLATVKFTGTIKPAGAPAPEPFAEVWNMQRAIKSTSGWKLAGIQQLT